MSQHSIGRDGRDDGAGTTDGEARSPGRTTRTASRYGALRAALDDGAAGGPAGPTIHAVATAAIEHKDGGRAMDGGVTARVGDHLGADFSGVKVHDDPLARQATAAMGARAFAYGSDVFLGPGESDGDLGLMAHELTHVAQQGAAGQRAPQGKVEVGAADSPAEREADAVAAQVTGGGARTRSRIVDDGPVQPGQMLKSTFLDQLRTAVTAASSEEMGELGMMGCPAIDQYFGRYASRPASEGEAFLGRYAPGTRGAADAAAMIPTVVARVRDGVRQWRDTGQVPADLPADAVPAGGPASAAMGPGQAMDGATASRMVDALGGDVAGARIHVGAEAAAFASRHSALAVTVGSDVAFASGAYRPGTLEGDALLAHELGHVAQQQGATGSARGDAGAALEDDADQAAGGAMARLWGGMKDLGTRTGAAMKSNMTLARCPDRAVAPAPNMNLVPAGPAREAAVALAASGAAIDTNTAGHLAAGRLRVYYLEDAVHPPNENRILTDMGIDPGQFMVITHPTSGALYYLQRNSEGFQPDADRTIFWGLRSASVGRWRTILVHETNHSRNVVPANILERYKSEFRAYWVAEFAGVADQDDRARQIKAHILANYPLIATAHSTDTPGGTQAAINGHTRPDGVLDNR